MIPDDESKDVPTMLPPEIPWAMVCPFGTADGIVKRRPGCAVVEKAVGCTGRFNVCSDNVAARNPERISVMPRRRWIVERLIGRTVVKETVVTVRANVKPYDFASGNPPGLASHRPVPPWGRRAWCKSNRCKESRGFQRMREGRDNMHRQYCCRKFPKRRRYLFPVLQVAWLYEEPLSMKL